MVIVENWWFNNCDLIDRKIKWFIFFLEFTPKYIHHLQNPKGNVIRILTHVINSYILNGFFLYFLDSLLNVKNYIPDGTYLLTSFEFCSFYAAGGASSN